MRQEFATSGSLDIVEYNAPLLGDIPVVIQVPLELVLALESLHVHSSPTPTGPML